MRLLSAAAAPTSGSGQWMEANSLDYRHHMLDPTSDTSWSEVGASTALARTSTTMR